jgi:uncharacterized membrane protein
VDVRVDGGGSVRPDELGLAVLFASSGMLHLLVPGRFEQIVPRPLPGKRALVYLSGVAELGCAAGLATPATRRAAGLVSAVLLVAVFPANVSMAVDVFAGRGRLAKLLAAARLPLQAPLVAIAWRAWRR